MFLNFVCSSCFHLGWRPFRLMQYLLRSCGQRYTVGLPALQAPVHTCCSLMIGNRWQYYATDSGKAETDARYSC